MLTFDVRHLFFYPHQGPNGEESERIAVKHLVPTTSPERIWMELDCLRVANGKENVIPLLFGHRFVLAQFYNSCTPETIYKGSGYKVKSLRK